MSAAQGSRDTRRGPRTRLVGILAGLTAVALAVTGCGTVPGAAIEIDGMTIPQQTVQQRTDAILTDTMPAGQSSDVDPQTRAMLNRDQTTDLVRHELVKDAARAENIDVDETKVNAFIADNGGSASIAQQLHVPAADVPDAIFDYLVLSDLVSAIPEQGVEVTNVTVTVDAVHAADRSEAVADRATYLSDPAAMDSDAAAARSAGQAPGGEMSLLKSAENAITGIFTAPEGEIVLFPDSNGGFYVIRVTKRVEEPATLTAQDVQASQTLDGYMVLSSLLLRKYAEDRTITVNPRFGTWDPKTLLVVPSSNGM